MHYHFYRDEVQKIQIISLEKGANGMSCLHRLRRLLLHKMPTSEGFEQRLNGFIQQQSIITFFFSRVGDLARDKTAGVAHESCGERSLSLFSRINHPI